MRGIPSLITDIRKNVFTEVARMAYSGRGYEGVDDLPYIPYHIINDLSDELFPPEQMDAYVETLMGKGHSVTYHRLPNCRHGELTGEEWEVIREFLLGHLVK